MVELAATDGEAYAQNAQTCRSARGDRPCRLKPRGGSGGAAASRRRAGRGSRPPAAPGAPAPAAADPYAEPVKLKELLDAGILTQEEFDAKKAQILAS